MSMFLSNEKIRELGYDPSELLERLILAGYKARIRKNNLSNVSGEDTWISFHVKCLDFLLRNEQSAERILELQDKLWRIATAQK